MILCPVFQDTSADFQYTIELNIQKVGIRAKWNSRNDHFHLSFTDEDGTELTGIKVVPNWPLLDIHQALTTFSGDFMIIKDDDSLENGITYENLGNGYNWYYLTEEEVEEWKTSNGL